MILPLAITWIQKQQVSKLCSAQILTLTCLCVPTWPSDSLINYMEYSLSWEADSSMGSQEIAHIVWSFKTHYHVHNSLPLVPILRQMNEVHTLPYYYCKNPSIPVSSKWSLSFMSPPPNRHTHQAKILYAFLFTPIHEACPTHLILLGLITWINKPLKRGKTEQASTM
jgi:hypothetical protein